MTSTEATRNPHRSPIEIDGHQFPASHVIEILGKHLTEPRKERIETVVAHRTYNLCVVLDDLYDRGNASAVFRSAEAMGIQSVHMIQPGTKFKEANRVTKGADKWLDIFKWKNNRDCIADLKQKGYRICATSLEASRPIQEVDFSVPTAFVLGNEKDGVSKEVLEAADERVIIPMEGFVQSFNISVAGAISFYHMVQERKKHLGFHGDLSQEEREVLKAVFYLRSCESAEKILMNSLT